MSDNNKILIVEDDLDLVEATKLILENNGYKVVTASDTADGMNKVIQEKPGLIILDVMFGSQGKSGGFQFAATLRQSEDLSSIPILMLTAVNVENPGFDFSPKTDGEYLPVDGFLDKPAQPEELLEKVRELIVQKTSKWAVKK